MFNATLIPRAGMIVMYALRADHVKQINADRANARAQRRFTDAQGNHVEVGAVYPMLITRAWGNSPGSAVNGTVFLDAPNETIWVTSASEGEGEGRFQFRHEQSAEFLAVEDVEPITVNRYELSTEDAERIAAMVKAALPPPEVEPFKLTDEHVSQIEERLRALGWLIRAEPAKNEDQAEEKPAKGQKKKH